VFTTDSGAIVGDGGARCLTVNGACTVTWRSQDPRVTGGLGTIIATATNGTANLATSTNFYYSGSYATVYQVTGSAGATTRLTGGSTIPLDFKTSCASQSIAIEIVDVNGNPMPEGTTVSGLNGTNASVAISPATIGFTGMRLNKANRGTVHSVTVTPSGCPATDTTPKTGFVDILVKTPLGGERSTRIDLGTFKGP
jgi:hypothetical protein